MTIMRTRLLSMGVLVAGLGLMATPSYGQNISKALITLAAGGKMIAGPGVFQGGADIVVPIAEFMSSELDVCTTATNIGPETLTIRFTIPAAPGEFVNVPSGQSRAICSDGVETVNLICATAAVDS